MMIEKWDILDKDGNPTGNTTLRGRIQLKPGEYHLVVHIWVLSSDGRYLLQRRSDTKKLMPGEWAATGGAAISGEDSFTAAKRELFEELGIKMTEQTARKAFRIKRRNSLLDVWITESDLPADSLILQESEVAEAMWVTEEKLKNMIKNNEFHNYGNDYFDRMFEETKNYRGALV